MSADTVENFPPSPPDPTSVIEDQALDAVAWMSLLMRARMVGDFEEAQEAKDRLNELGVVVAFRRGPTLGKHTPPEVGP